MITDLSNKGWECPKCGRGLAPHVSECPCFAGEKPVMEKEDPKTIGGKDEISLDSYYKKMKEILDKIPASPVVPWIDPIPNHIYPNGLPIIDHWHPSRPIITWISPYVWY